MKGVTLFRLMGESIFVLGILWPKVLLTRPRSLQESTEADPLQVTSVSHAKHASWHKYIRIGNPAALTSPCQEAGEVANQDPSTF